MTDAMTNPPDPGRRERKRAQTLDHLADTAFALFEMHGYDAVTMEQIAAAADVAKGTLYNHFAVKEALLAHRFHREFAAGRVELRDRIEAEPHLSGQLVAVMDASAGWSEAHRHYLPHYYRYRFTTASERSGIEDAFAALIAGGQQRGEVRRDLSAEQLAMMIKQLYFGAVWRWLHTPELDLRAELSAVIDVFLNGTLAGRQA